MPSTVDFRKARALVIGDVMLDRYWHGPASRISPEAPVPIVHVNDTEHRPGGAANVAMNVRSLGATPVLLGVAGEDEAGDQLEALLRDGDVRAHLVRSSQQPTVTKLRVVSRQQQLLRLDFESPASRIELGPLMERFRQGLDQSDVVIFSDYGKGALRDVRDLIGLARERRCPVVVDPKGDSFEQYRGATLITPNLAELETVVGRCPDREAIVEKGSRLREELGLSGLLVTRSEHGMLLLSDDPPLELPTRAQEVYDVTGAGDTVVAVLAAAIGAGATLAEATELSNRAAGIVVSRLGTASVTAAELDSAGESKPRHAIIDEDELWTCVRAAQANGERIVMTNGCFDLLHVGHISYLE
ncbi:MAG: D-glycero-beta-D-manno-heptose-7-phosphate kinase, partial [Pseudomonadota bacterium]